MATQERAEEKDIATRQENKDIATRQTQFPVKFEKEGIATTSTTRQTQFPVKFEKPPKRSLMIDYNDLLFQYTGLKETSNSPEELEEAMLKTVDEAVDKFLQDDNLSIKKKKEIKTKYDNFRRTIPEKAKKYDKLNVLSIFAASIFENYLFSNEGMLERMRKETNDLLLKNRECEESILKMYKSVSESDLKTIRLAAYESIQKFREGYKTRLKNIHRNKGIDIYELDFEKKLLEIDSDTYHSMYKKIYNSQFGGYIYDNNNNNWTIVIKRGATSLSTIMTAFCKKVFFAGLQTKEIMTHDKILLPLTYLLHDLGHFSIFSNKERNKIGITERPIGILGKPHYDHTRCSQFIQFIKEKYETTDKQNLNLIYIFLFAYLFETVDNFDESWIPLGYMNKNGNFEYKTNWGDVFSFNISLPVFLIVYDVVCKAENNFLVSRMTYPYDLQDILPKQMKSEQITMDDKFEELVSTYNKQSVLLFLQNYYEFMVLSGIEGLGYVDGIELNCENGKLRETSQIKKIRKPSTKEPSTKEPSTKEPSTKEPSTKEPSTKEPSTRQFTFTKGGKRTKKGRNKKSKKSKQQNNIPL
jgi:hypothetical protein